MAYHNRNLVYMGLEDVFLRCTKCGRKTRHILTSTVYTFSVEEVEETYECQECGETKKIYEFVFRLLFPSHSRLTLPTIDSPKIIDAI